MTMFLNSRGACELAGTLPLSGKKIHNEQTVVKIGEEIIEITSC